MNASSSRGSASSRTSSRAKVAIVAVIAGALLVIDLSRAPDAQWSAKALLGAIGVYQATLSPVVGFAGVRCRFVPTCSHYAADAVRKDGALIGFARAVGRVARCGPWTPAGTIDPA